MKKSMIAVLAALLVLSSIGAFAMDASYVQGGAGGVVVPSGAPQESAMSKSTGMGPNPAHTFAYSKATVCAMDIKTDPQDQYFLGKARTECVTNNRNNIFCQKRCFDQVRFMAQRYSTASRPRESYLAYYVTGCNDVDAAPLAGMIGNTCYFKASELCSTANPSNNYCRQKCNQRLYTSCRASFLDIRQQRAKSTMVLGPASAYYH